MPDWVPYIRQNYILPSQTEGVYLYQRCPGAVPEGEGENASCATDYDFVVYDYNLQVILHILEDPNTILMTGEDSLGRPQGYSNAAWSASGRYLVYQYIRPLNSWDLRVYDMVADRNLDVQFWNAEIDPRRAIQWSPQGNRLAFLIVGRAGEPVAGDDPRILRHLVFYDADQERFQVADQPFGMAAGLNIRKTGTWSPDGSAFAFIITDQRLIVADATTGETTQLDTHVERIFAWVPTNEDVD
ncbi:MAG: hypothetical protein GYB65_03425 [Chloroflexi bacterium]|nr:hypothetical protein [Chloroflexota bacterium]